MTNLSSRQGAHQFSGENGRITITSNGNGRHQPAVVENGRGKLTGKVALVVGPLTSEARELVYALAHHGAEIALVYRPEDHLRARHISQRIRAGSRQCLLIPVPAQQRVPRRTVHRVIDHFGHLDIFIDRSVALQGDGYEENVLFPSSHLMAAAMNRLVSS